VVLELALKRLPTVAAVAAAMVAMAAMPAEAMRHRG
jgi:hypothetical protein